MSVIEVQGLTPLEGEIKIQGSKNAVLPMMAAVNPPHFVRRNGTQLVVYVFFPE